jgi:hypothetical protein
MPTTKIFRGKTYKRYLSMKSEKYAKEAVNRLRKAGIAAQYVKEDVGWRIYTREVK